MSAFRPASESRLLVILDLIQRHSDGFDPFALRRREQRYVLWRQAIWHKMRLEGYSCSEIGRATMYDHATVFWGTRRFVDALDVRDPLACRTWDRLNEMLKAESKYYGD